MLKTQPSGNQEQQVAPHYPLFRQQTNTSLKPDNRSSKTAPGKPDPRIDVRDGSGQIAADIIFMSGTAISAFMGPYVLYKLSTTPRLGFTRDPQLWGGVASPCAGLTVASAAMIQWETWRAYESSREGGEVRGLEMRCRSCGGARGGNGAGSVFAFVTFRAGEVERQTSEHFL
jgi:hypothetical protein